METINEGKKRVSYADFIAGRNGAFQEGTLAWVLERYYQEWRQRIGLSQYYTIRRIQRTATAKLMAAKLKPSDIIAYCQVRIKQPLRPGSAKTVQPQTINQDITYMRVALDYASSGWDMPEITAKAIEDALPKLIKFGLIGKSRPRDRRPTSAEWDALINSYNAPDDESDLPMAEIMEFQVWSARRISETCRALCADVNQDKRTLLVRDMKDPKKKKGNHKEVPLLGRAWDIVERRLQTWDGNPTARLFPYRSQSVSQSFTLRKKKLGIENLRLHDLRREAASRLFEAGFAVQEVMMVTGHTTPMMLLRVYTKLKPEDLHKGPAAKRGVSPDIERVSFIQNGHDDIREQLRPHPEARP